jgi:hypothetical protein
MEFDVERIVDQVTREIMKRLGNDCVKKVFAASGCPSDAFSCGYEIVSDGDPGNCDYVLLTAAEYRALAGRGNPETGACGACETEPERVSACCGGETVDLRGKRLLHERDLREHNACRDMVFLVSKKTIITALAHDYAKGLGVKIVREN